MKLTSSLETIERIESLKAGVIGALAAGTAFALITLLHAVSAQFSLTAVPSLLENLTHKQLLPWLISGSIALLSGFLFSVTYRYVIRQDKNPQLKSGAIMAFGLVRGLAQVELMVDDQLFLWQQGLPVAESLLMFVVVALSLDWAIIQGWVKPMK